MTKKKKLLLSAIILCALLLCFSLFMIVYEISNAKKSIENFEKLTLLAEQNVTTVTQEVTPPTVITAEGESTTATQPETSTVTVRDLAPVFEMNPDCVGWIYVPNTNINYPVMHTPDDPEKYLRTDFEGKHSSAGVPFIDGRGNADNEHFVIYGHNMRNGTMFADLKKYIDESFFEANPYFEYQTADGVEKYQIFSILLTQQDDRWYFFNNSLDENDYRITVWDAVERSFHYTGIIPKYGDKLISLSTCYGRSDDDRLVIVGVRIN